MKEILQLKISLDGIKPMIWRRFQVLNTISFNELQEIIQKVMGWKNYHLWEFKIGNKVITPPDEEGYLAEGTIDKLMKSSEFKKMIEKRDLSKGSVSLDINMMNKILKKVEKEEKEKNPFSIETSISKLINKEGQKFSYRYDFGDDWEHTLIIEKIFNEKDTQRFPVCQDGERACPPEDCGGVEGYERFLEVLKTGKDPWGENVNELKRWLRGWDPERFDPEKINKRIA